MDSFLVGAQLLLAAVFAVAGTAKLLDQPGSRRALADFGVPEWGISVAGLVLPLAELATAVALVVPASARWGAVAALVLLLAFIAGIASALARGQAPDCHCFGQLHSAPAGRGTLARNAALGGLAAILVVHGTGPPIDDWVAARTTTELVALGAGILVALLAALCARLWIDNRGLREDLDYERKAVALFPQGLPIGASAPRFLLEDPQGETLSLDSLLERGRPVTLVFMSPSCGPCATLLPELGRWQATLSERLTIGLLSEGSAEENQEVVEKHGLVDLVLQDDSDVMDAYRVRATPSAVTVMPDGRIASVAAEGLEAIEALIRLELRTERKARVQVPANANGGGSEHTPLSLWRSG